MNDRTIEEIKECSGVTATRLFEEYERKYGFEHLAEIFNRFKPLFLAFKLNSTLSNCINRINKLSKIYHKPMKEDYLNTVTISHFLFYNASG